MRFLTGLICFFLLVSCSVQVTREQAAGGTKEIRVDQWKEVVAHKMNERQFPFTLKVRNDKRMKEFTGLQLSSDWSLKDQRKKLVMEKKGQEVSLHYSGRTEKMTSGQAGLVSPRDHLMLMHDSGIFQRMLPPITFLGKKAARVEIKIDPKTLANQMKKRLNTTNPKARIMQDFAEKTKVVYQVVFYPESKKLLLLRVVIRASPRSPAQEIIYKFS
ncbi:hypothetical protein [Lihuaxuella thermophila]|uniref:Lipoprotein n=1 Tax=Lihuaxuella thermophila TaxID=1173111 RepID=A0A1H8FEQ4_9BACL|nr:hypothetical protein [Lihuaxuella thermophila]SEN29667.1 hypothetical protein SAMN05444955_108140 [Lihuaxuella thermophila]